MAAEENSRRQHIREWVSAGHAIVVVDSVVVGYAALEYTFFGCGFIAMLMVNKASRLKGAATDLISELEISQFRKLELLSLREIEQNHKIRKDLS